MGQIQHVKSSPLGIQQRNAAVDMANSTRSFCFVCIWRQSQPQSDARHTLGTIVHIYERRCLAVVNAGVHYLPVTPQLKRHRLLACGLSVTACDQQAAIVTASSLSS